MTDISRIARGLRTNQWHISDRERRPVLLLSDSVFICDAIKARYTLAIKSTVAENGDKSATKSTVADTVDFVAGFGNKSATELN